MLGEGLLCADCHSSSHGTKLATRTANRSYERLVSFRGTGTWAWKDAQRQTRTCSNLGCHGTEEYTP